MKTGNIFNIQKFCIHDGDGIRTCVFLKGCPLRCIWCHNPESLSKSPNLSFDKSKCSLCGRCFADCSARKAENNALIINRDNCSVCGKCTRICLNGANDIIGREITAAEVIETVLQDKMFYETSGGGITVTGGEPSYQPEFTLELLRLSSEAEISLAIETCGTGSREFYKEAAKLGTTFLFDIKTLNPEKHKAFTGADNAHVLSNLEYLMQINADIIIRLPLIPDCNDSNEDIADLSEFLNRNKGKYRYAEIMPYHTLGISKAEKNGVDSPFVHQNATDDDISRWCSLFSSHSADVRVSK